VWAVTEAILDTADKLVLKTKPSPYMKRWWSLELSKLQAETRWWGRKAYANRHEVNHESHAKYRAVHNQYTDKIKGSKRAYWEKLLEQVDEKTVWTAHKIASAEAADGGGTRIPMLSTKRGDGAMWEAVTNKEKADMLFSSFFPASSSETRIPIDDLHYPPNTFDYQPITDEQIRRAIHKLNPFKAPGANGIPNIVIKQCTDTLIPFIGPIFCATFSLEVYLDTWKDSIMRVV